LPAEVGKKLPEAGKIVKLWSRHFRSTASPAAYPGEGTIFWSNDTQLIYRRRLKYRASFVAR
jgi:hypothetical protein